MQPAAATTRRKGRRFSWRPSLGLVALPVALPLAYLAYLASTLSFPELLRVWSSAGTGALLLKMLVFSSGTTLFALLLALPWAFLCARCDIPGRRLFTFLAPLPLAIPPYVAALLYAMLLAPGGTLHRLLATFLDQPLGSTAFPSLIYSPLGAGFILGLFTTPYLFLSLYSSLRALNPAYEEVARSLGHSAGTVFWKVTLPMLRPALLAGSLLVFLYAWVDFGVVSLLRVRTFTTLIYNYLLAGYSLEAAAGLSLVLVGVVWLILVAQQKSLGQARYTGSHHESPTVSLGVFKPLALLFLILVNLLALGVPISFLAYQALSYGSLQAVATLLAQQLPFLFNSLLVGVAGATAAIALGGFLAWLSWRGRAGFLAPALLQSGYAIPGTVLGLSLVGLTLSLFPALYSTPPVLVMAYLVLFSMPAFQALRANFMQIPRSYEEAARSLGKGSFGALRHVLAPVAWPGILASWLLVFVLSIRELAATVILRPPGFDTLPVRIWVHGMDVGADPASAVIALLLVSVIGAVWLLAVLFGRFETPLHATPPQAG